MAGVIGCAVLMAIVAMAWWRSYSAPYFEEIPATPPFDESGWISSKNGLREMVSPDCSDAHGFNLSYDLYYWQAMLVVGLVAAICAIIAIQARGRMGASCQRPEDSHQTSFP
jgi:hypothetical protein